MREGREGRRREEGEGGILIKLTLPSRVRRMRYFKIWGAGSLITPPTRSLLTWMVSLAIEGKRGDEGSEEERVRGGGVHTGQVMHCTRS